MSHSSGAGPGAPGRRFRFLWIAGLVVGVAGGALVAVTLVGAAPTEQVSAG